MNIKRHLLVLFICLIGVSLSAGTGIFDPSALKLYIKLDKRNFFSDERVMLRMRVKNESGNKVFFHVYDTLQDNSQDYSTFQPVVFDMTGHEAETTVEHKLKEHPVEKIIGSLEPRMVELGPGESIEHKIDVKTLYNLDLNKNYRIKAYFFPNFENSGVIKSGNELIFKIIAEKHLNKVSRVDSVKRGISPQEIILLLLNAEKHKDWNRFLKYVNIEKFIHTYPDFVRRYRTASADDKDSIEQEFCNYLARERDDYLMKFKILKQDIENDDQIAYVEVMVDRYGIKRTNRYKYRYKLERYNDSWLIVDMDATIQKGIKR